jgi:hypothetical protein
MPRLGQIVTYVDLRADGDASPFRRAVASGDVVDDPLTGQRWIVVVRPDLVLALIGPSMVVDVTPASTAGARFPHTS